MSAPAQETKPVAAEQPKELPKFEKSIADKLEKQFGTKVSIEFVKPTRIRARVDKNNVVDIARFIRDELHFDHAESVTGVDYPDQKEIEVVYHLGSYTDAELAGQVMTLATRAPREDNPNPGNDSTRLPSLRDIFYSVEFHERECFEMLGVYFEGHPDNRRLLLPEDWADLPPLRKDFKIKGR
ncbi:MAG: NADH-quinone oxidoreductase subunit C [Candidatus Nitrosotenuis sp.]